MPLAITYTCNWCNKTHSMDEVKTPPEWLSHNIHDPSADLGETEGFFCQENCKTLYEEHQPGAIASAREHYSKEFYSYLNKMKANEANKPVAAT